MRKRTHDSPYARQAYHPNMCTSCNQWVEEGQKVCACGTATSFMSFAERAEHEAAQWRAHLGASAEAN